MHYKFIEMNKVKTLSVRISTSLEDRLHKECETKGVRVTDIVRLALEFYLRDSAKVQQLSKTDLTAFYIEALKLELGSEG